MSAKTRGENFTLLQRMGLIEVIKIHQKVVEDKRSDTFALAKKNRKRGKTSPKEWQPISLSAPNLPPRTYGSYGDV